MPVLNLGKLSLNWLLKRYRYRLLLELPPKGSSCQVCLMPWLEREHSRCGCIEIISKQDRVTQMAGILKVSPDGTLLQAGSGGSLVTSDGTWNFSTSKASTGNY